MSTELCATLVRPKLAILAGILVPVAPRLLNDFASVYLNVLGFEPSVRVEAAQSPAGAPA